MDNLNAISILEETLEYSSQLDDLERKFDEVYPNFDNSQDYLSSLRQIKIFLGREKEFRYCLLKDTKLKGSDCLTMAILAAILANRKGYSISICRPKGVSHYFHTALVYNTDGQHTFKVTGRSYPIDPIPFNNDQIISRLKITKPFVDFVNGKIRRVY